MRNERHSIKIFWNTVVVFFVILLSDLGLCGGPVQAEGYMNSFPEASLQVTHQIQAEESPLIGGGIKHPPDIGAAGTASPTPPVRTESPTDEPELLPPQSPIPPAPNHSRSSSSTGRIEIEPLGDPEFIQEDPVIQR